MIFVTVGTHEQQFNRLVQYVDELVGEKKIDEKVVIQTGYSDYKPKYSQWSSFIPYQKMVEYVSEARVVITHGGPSSFIMPLQVGKIPIVVPRQKQFDEHVNNHQLAFAKIVAEKHKNIILVEDIKTLKNIIQNYDMIVSNMSAGLESNNKKFNDEFCKIVASVFKDAE